MEERDIIELNLRLPAGQLGRLARLMEQVRGLLAAEGSGAAGPASPGGGAAMEEAGVSTAFDGARFRRLAGAETAYGGGKGLEAVPEGVKGAAENSLAEIPTAGGETGRGPAGAVSAGAGATDGPEAEGTDAEVSAELSVPAVEAEVPPGPEIPVGSTAAAERGALAAAAALPPEAEGPAELPLPAVPAVQRDLEAAESAGSPVETAPAEAQGGAFAAVEELVRAGAAPLTAESVALAFQRDDRRYDNGFPLY